MKAIGLLCFLATGCLSALCAEDARVTRTVPATAYHVILHANEQWSVPRVIGRIPEVEQMEIKVSADKVTADKSVSLSGNAVVTVVVGGKVITTYEGPELVLTPVARAATPLSYEESSKNVRELDQAIARRDTAQVLAFFADDAKITVEALTPSRVEVRTFTRDQYGDYLKSLFPAALRIHMHESPWARHGGTGPGEQSGGNVLVAKDGLSAEIGSNVRFVVTYPEGELHWDLMRRMTAEKRGEKIVITSLDVRLPKDISERWPEPKQPVGARQRQRQVLPQ